MPVAAVTIIRETVEQRSDGTVIASRTRTEIPLAAIVAAKAIDHQTRAMMPGKDGRMNIAFRWLLVIGAVYALYSVATKDDDPARRSSPRDGVLSDRQVEIVRVSVTDLFNEYDRNEVATDMRLSGKVVEISGAIQSINKNFRDKPYIVLATPNRFMGAHMEPVAADTDKVARLSKGQRVTFRCEKMKRFMGAPNGDNCVLMD